MAGPGQIRVGMSFPDFAPAFGQLRQILKQSEFTILMKKSLMAGGRVMLREVKELVPQKTRSRTRKDRRVTAISTGLLKKSMKILYRPGKKRGPSIIIGADRSVVAERKRGLQTIQQSPAHYVHLVDRGFVAIARKPGVKGRNNDWILKLLRKDRLQKILADKSPLPATDKTRYDRTRRMVMTELSRVLQVVAQHQNAKRTPVPGQKFMERAAQATQAAAIQTTTATLKADLPKYWEKALKRMATLVKREQKS